MICTFLRDSGLTTVKDHARENQTDESVPMSA